MLLDMKEKRIAKIQTYFEQRQMYLNNHSAL